MIEQCDLCGWDIKAGTPVPQACCACTAPLAYKLRTYFLKIRVCLVGLLTRAMLLLQLHTTNQIRECCAQFGYIFTFKFAFTNCTPDFSIKNYVRINHGSSYVCRKLIYYMPRMRRTQAVQHMHGAVVCSGLSTEDTRYCDSYLVKNTIRDKCLLTIKKLRTLKTERYLLKYAHFSETHIYT